MFVGVFRIPVLVGSGWFFSGCFLLYVFYRAGDLVRPVGSLVGNLPVRSSESPSLFLCFSILLCWATIRAGRCQRRVVQVLRVVVGVFHFFLNCPFMVVYDQDRSRVLPIYLVRAFERRFEVGGRQGSFFAGFFRYFPFAREWLRYVRAVRYVPGGFQDRA